MDFYELSDSAIITELGARLKALRLRRNITQAQLATHAQVSISTIKNLEAGKGNLANTIAVLRELRALESLDHFIPEISISPIAIAKRKGKLRKRASKSEK